MGNQSQDEVFLAAQEAVGAHRDSQGRIDDLIFLTLLLQCNMYIYGAINSLNRVYFQAER